jgi:hypothetical protein
MAITENKKSTENTMEAVQATENANVDKEGTGDSVFHSILDEKWNTSYQSVTAQPQPIFAPRPTSSPEEIFNAKQLKTILAMSEMLEMVSARMKDTVGHQMASSLNVAAKSQEFFDLHALHPEITTYNQQYPVSFPLQYTTSYAGSCFGGIPQHVRNSLPSHISDQYIKNNLYNGVDGSFNLPIQPGGDYATLMTDGSWTVRMPDGSRKKVLW